MTQQRETEQNETIVVMLTMGSGEVLVGSVRSSDIDDCSSPGVKMLRPREFLFEEDEGYYFVIPITGVVSQDDEVFIHKRAIETVAKNLKKDLLEVYESSASKNPSGDAENQDHDAPDTKISLNPPRPTGTRMS